MMQGDSISALCYQVGEGDDHERSCGQKVAMCN